MAGVKRRRYSPGRRAKRRKKAKARQRRRARYGKRLPKFAGDLSFLPPRIHRRLVYTESQHISLSGAAILGACTTSGNLIYNLNSCYDPRYAAGGHQPRGYDEICQFYNMYRVTSARMTVRGWSDGAAGFGVMCASFIDNDTTHGTSTTHLSTSQIAGSIEERSRKFVPFPDWREAPPAFSVKLADLRYNAKAWREAAMPKTNSAAANEGTDIVKASYMNFTEIDQNPANATAFGVIELINLQTVAAELDLIIDIVYEVDFAQPNYKVAS